MAATLSAATFDGASVEDVLEHLEQNLGIQELSCRLVLDDANIETFQDAILLNRRLVASLYTLKLSGNNLSSCSLPSLARILQCASSLRHLDLSENHLGDTCNNAGLELFVNVLTSSESRLESLNLAQNKLGPKASASLARLLRNNTTIHTLSLAHNALGTKTLKAIGPSLSQNTTLRQLNISYNKLSDRGMSMLATALWDDDASRSQLATLDLQYNKIGPAGAFVIFKALLLQTHHKHLVSLNLSLNCIGPDGAQVLGAVLKYSHLLEEIHVGRNDMGAGVMGLLEGLAESHVTRLRVLDLSWNSLTDDAAVYLAEHVLAKNTHLAVLNLASNAISDRGVLALARALEADLGLRELDIVGNQARDESAFAMANLLTSRHCHLQTLKWEKNNFTQAGKMRLRAAFAYRDSLTKWLDSCLKEIRTRKVIALDFSARRIGDNELIAICRALAKYKPRVPTLWLFGQVPEGKHTVTDSDDDGGNLQFITSRGIAALAGEVLAKNAGRIERLYVDNCSQVDDEGWAALADALRTNTTVLILSLTRSNVGMEAVKRLASALERNNKLQRLNLGDNALGDAVIEELARSLQARQQRSPLKSVNLSRNNITDKGLAVFPTLGANIGLQELHLAGNSITDAGALDLAKAFIHNTSVRWVNLSQNRLSYRGKRALKLFLPDDATLETDEQHR
jgi:Ran GTPase-activating protein (RanGAP) involved in mRNA processing and transport